MSHITVRLLPIRYLGYGDHPSSGLSFSGSWTTYQLLPWWQISRRVPSPIFTRQLSHTRPSPITHDRGSCQPTSAKGKILPSYHLIPHGTYSPSGRHSTRAVASLIDFSPKLTLRWLFNYERMFHCLTSHSMKAKRPEAFAMRAKMSPYGTKQPCARASTVGFLSYGNPCKNGLNGYGKE